jgi:propanol-preferring alcohol dehydrogenase
VGTRQDTHDALGFVARGQVKPILRVEPFDKINEVYQEMRDGKIAGRVVLDLTK